MKITILGHLPSGNQLLRMHWAKRRKMIEQWAWAVKKGLQKANINYVGNTSYFKSPVSISATVFIKDQRGKKDDSNIITSLDKLIIDNMVKQKIFVDDSPDYLEYGHINQAVDREERIEIEIVKH